MSGDRLEATMRRVLTRSFLPSSDVRLEKHLIFLAAASGRMPLRSVFSVPSAVSPRRPSVSTRRRLRLERKSLTHLASSIPVLPRLSAPRPRTYSPIP